MSRQAIGVWTQERQVHLLASKHTGQGFQKGSTGLSDFSFLSPYVMPMGVGLHDMMERLSGR